MQKFLVVGHHQGGSFVIFQGVDEALDRFHVQVVRGFVQQQHVAGAGQDLPQQNAAPLATAQDFYLLESRIAAEHHEPSKPAGAALLRHLFDSGGDFFFDGIVQVQAVDIRLSEIVYL